MGHPQNLIVAVLGIALVSTGCGRKEVPEAPEPVAVQPAPHYTPVATPVSVDRIEPVIDTRPIVEERIHFALDRSDLTPEARAILTAKVDVLRSTPGMAIRIEGHADERGSDEYNLALSKRRAAEAKRFLVARGIDASRLETVGFGEEQPLDRTSSEAAWAMNRRAGFQVIGGAVSQR